MHAWVYFVFYTGAAGNQTPVSSVVLSCEIMEEVIFKFVLEISFMLDK